MIRVNLLKAADKKEVDRKVLGPEAEGQAVKKKKGPNTNLIILGAIVAVGGLALLQKRALDRERLLLRMAKDEQATLAPVIAKLAEVEQSKTFLELKVGLIQSLRQQQPTPVRVLEALSACLPEWVWLTEATFRNRILEVKGRALSNVLISDFMDALQKSSLFDTVNLMNSQQQTIGNDSFVNFTLNALLPPAPAVTAGPGTAPRKPQP
ncbi:MAG: PilN domain-containing protein [Candidatus Aminicenantes bacterium]|nr:PilN domain-containing protein [Candidatus Aminicenantes bacterium]